MRGVRTAIVVAVAALSAAMPPSASAAFEPTASQPPVSLQQFAAADARHWLAYDGFPSSAYLTTDAGSTWQPVLLAGDTLMGAGGAADGSFRLVVTRWSGDQRNLYVHRVSTTGDVIPIAGPIPVGPSPQAVGVEDDGSVWIAPNTDAADMWLVGTTGGVTTVPVPGNGFRTIHRTPFGMRMVVGDGPPLRLEGQQLAPAEPRLVRYVDGDFWLGAGSSFDGGVHWVSSSLGIQPVTRVPGVTSMPRYFLRYLAGGDSYRVLRRHSSWLLAPTDLATPAGADATAVYDTGDALVAGGPGGVFVHHGPLPAPPASIGALPSDAQAMISRANLFRGDAGLPPLLGDASISRAARNHSNYTRLNGQDATSAHDETPGRPGYTGMAPSDRCAHVGTICSSEVMFGDGATDPVAGWLATPFHRFLPGAPTSSLVGAGRVDGGSSVMNGAGQAGVLTGAFGYPNGRWRGPRGFAGEIPDPVAVCNAAGKPIAYPVGIAVTLYVPSIASHLGAEAGSGETIEVRRRSRAAPLPGCLLDRHFILDDPLIEGETYDVAARWRAADGLLLTYRWSFAFQPEPSGMRSGDRTGPTLSRLSLSARRFRLPPRPRLKKLVGSLGPNGRVAASTTAKRRRSSPVGTQIEFTTSERGRLRFRIERRAPGRLSRSGRGSRCVEPTRQLVRIRAKRCKRLAVVGSSSHRMAAAGRQSFRFLGKIQRGWLAPGSYRMRAWAHDRAGNSSEPRVARFVVARR